MTENATIGEQKKTSLCYVLATLLPMAVLAAVLWGMGRIGWCEQGFGLWTSNPAGPCTSQHLADPYTFTHFEHGLLFFGLAALCSRWLTLYWRYAVAVMLEVGWEMLENTPWVIERYRQQTAALGYTGDSILNSCGDLLACCLGFVVAARLPMRSTIALFIVMELALLATIRDNLTLNVLMLLLPLPALQDWQLGK
jgi:hypothetical protein